MPEAQAFPLVTRNGRRGRVFRKARFLDRNESNRVELEDGTELNVSASVLKIQPDGTFLLDDAVPNAPEAEAPVAPEANAAPESQAAPGYEERPEAEPEPLQNQLTEEQVVHTMANKAGEPITVADPLFTEDVHVEKVAVNRILDAPVQVRQEGDVTIIPVIEEVITVQKRLLLREEIHITRRRTELREPRRILLDTGEARTYGADGREIETGS